MTRMRELIEAKVGPNNWSGGGRVARPMGRDAALNALYDIIDAELNSDKTVHALWEKLKSEHHEFRAMFALNIMQHIDTTARREAYNLGLPVTTYTTQCIAAAIAQVWVKTEE